MILSGYANALPGGINSSGIIFKNVTSQLRVNSNRLYEAGITKLLSEAETDLILSIAVALTGNKDNISKSRSSLSGMKDRNNAILLSVMTAF